MPLGVYPRPSAMDRFVDRITLMPDGCWQWTGATNGQGYGVLGVSGKNVRVHRFSYEQFVGPIPEGLGLDHLCRNRSEVEPW